MSLRYRRCLLIPFYLLPVFLFLKAEKAEGQQEAVFSQYMFNTTAINPAYAGSRNALSITALHRNQWVGIKGAPKTTTFSADMATWNGKLGLGIIAFNDEIGVSKSTGAYAIYTYRIRFENEGSLAIGLQGGITNYRANLAQSTLTEPGDPVFSANVRSVLPAFGAGIYYNTDRFYVGLSAPNMIKSYLRKGKYLYASETIAQRFAHMFLMMGYVFPVSEDMKLKPSFLLKYVKGSPMQGDINLQAWIKDVVSVGGSYRTDKSGAMLAEVQATPQLRIGYAYDILNKNLQSFSSGTHEVMIRYEFGFNKERILSPRYF